MRRPLPLFVLLVVAAAVAAFVPSLSLASVPAPVHACAPPAPGSATCFAEIASSGRDAAAVRRALTGLPSGYGPAQLQAAYGFSGQSVNAGSSQTVAIVDAYDDPNAEADMGAYRAQYGLPACTTAGGCFEKVNENGGATPPSPDSGWSVEISLDLDMVSAMCPYCHILLVEADGAYFSDLATAEDTAASMGATQISNSYGGGEYSGETSMSSDYSHPGVAITASSGDYGYGVAIPAALPGVEAVGGTSLTPDSNSARGWDESVWSGAGSGCSAYVAKPSWQTDSGCAQRTVADVSAVADPNTGLAVYDTYQSGGWMVVGGTSASSPLVAAMNALIGPSAATPGYPYAHSSSYNDVTSGSNGTCSPNDYLCTGEIGYDGPTGVGTPNGQNLLGSPAAPTVTTGSASSVLPASATVNGTVNPNGLDTNYLVEYGTSTAYGSEAPASVVDAGAGWSAVSASVPLSSLKPSTTYHFTIIAANSMGTASGSDATFTTGAAAAPSVTTGAAEVGGQTSATINGVVTPNNSATTYQFEWGTTSQYGNVVPLVAPGIGAGNTALSESATVTGLSPGTTYHYTVIATNARGTTTGSDATFTTPAPQPPGVLVGGASAVSATAATISGVVNPNALSTTYQFEYGPTTGYGTASPAVTLSSGTSDVAVSASLKGLLPNTTYHYAILATSTAGSSWSADATFTTPRAAASVAAVAVSNVYATSATLGGTVDPNGLATTYYFRYGTSTHYGSATASTSAGAGQSAVSVAANLTGLAPSTTYHVVLVAVNAVGTVSTKDTTFSTHAKPAVVTGGATQLASQSATLSGTVVPNGLATTYQFRYGTTIAFGSAMPVSAASAGSGTKLVTETAALSGLAANTSYRYELVATSAAGTTVGPVKTFKTPASSSAKRSATKRSSRRR